ncbi:YbaB/EbfC family nucleoid-associated protein [Afifella sp. IM 167]|uniref:YbaB/EbfC family nucleoid-associated protein n=1 Tax=Afifella sp. IM 167 TaxID=2033586 RepID=UPI001CCD6352|nr:YbaB/EbfC family nucleoid-associated protein [Afifella sp. IM 167]
MRDLMGMMKQAKQLQEKMQTMQEEIAATEVEGSSGGGLVSCVVDGKGGLKRVKVDPSLMKEDEVEILEDLIVAAVGDARGKADQMMQEKMSEMTAGLPLPPGMKLPF